MTEASAVASFRRVTPGIVASARLAMANDVPDATKSEMALLLKKAAPVLGIDGATYHVMDILLGLSRADDWKGTGRPIVAISNAKLAEYTMRSERTVIRCIRRLVEAGIAAYRDSSTGRRFIYRGETGEIISGFGIDFTPSRVRAAELRHTVAEYQRRLAAELAARRDIARLSRAIEDLCAAFPEETGDFRAELASVGTSQGDCIERAAKVHVLHERVTETIAPQAATFKMSGEGDMSVISYNNTTQESYLESNAKRTRGMPRDTIHHRDRSAVEKALEKKAGEFKPRAQGQISLLQRDVTAIQEDVLGSVSLGLLQAACTQAQEMIAVRFDSWASLGRAGEMLRRMIGLSQSGWENGRDKVGLYAAAAILATVLEKSIRDPDQITRPGGYFRAMIDRAVDGKLKLERSLFGLADHRQGENEKCQL